MTTDDRVMTILERANPVPPEEVPDVAIGAARYLDDLQQRSSMVSVRTNPDSPSTRRRWAMISAAAAVVALVVAAAFVIGRGDDDNVVVDTPDSVPDTTAATAPEVTAPATLAPTPPGVDGAQAIAASLFAAHNRGATDDLLSLLADDARWTEDYSGLPPGPDNGEVVPPGEIELYLAWDHAQGTIWAEPVCVPAGEQPETGLALSCEWETRDALILAVDGASVATRALVVVSEEAIEQFHVVYAPDFTDLGNPFDGWLRLYHPGVTGTDCCGGETRAESEQRGRLRAQWAAEWATWLETWGCAVGELCNLEVNDWAAEYGAQCAVLSPTDEMGDLVAYMTGIPRTVGSPAANRLFEADQSLTGDDVSDEQVAELQQQRLDAMIELGIDERCHPVVE